MRSCLLALALLPAFAGLHAQTYKLDGQTYSYEKAFGLQAGYSWATHNRFDLGLNYCFSRIGKKFLLFTNSGFFATLSGMPVKEPKSFYLGGQAGAYVHFVRGLPGLRLAVLGENNCKNDFRLGGEIGIGFVPLYLCLGYYYPLNKSPEPVLPNLRLSLRFIFNMAAVRQIDM